VVHYVQVLCTFIFYLIESYDFFQEVLFFEEGEPKIDGEPGDLKVCFVPVSIWLKFT